MPQVPMMIEPPGPKFPYYIPLRENCDPTNPYQAFLWMLVALPNVAGAQLLMPIDWLQLVSKRLWDLGARPVEEPTLTYRAPPNMDARIAGQPGDWVAP